MSIAVLIGYSAIAVIKFITSFITGSSAMLSEGIHLRELDIATKNEHEAVKRIFIEAEDILAEV